MPRKMLFLRKSGAFLGLLFEDGTIEIHVTLDIDGFAVEDGIQDNFSAPMSGAEMAEAIGAELPAEPDWMTEGHAVPVENEDEVLAAIEKLLANLPKSSSEMN